MLRFASTRQIVIDAALIGIVQAVLMGRSTFTGDKERNDSTSSSATMPHVMANLKKRFVLVSSCGQWTIAIRFAHMVLQGYELHPYQWFPIDNFESCAALDRWEAAHPQSTPKKRKRERKD